MTKPDGISVLKLAASGTCTLAEGTVAGVQAVRNIIRINRMEKWDMEIFIWELYEFSRAEHGRSVTGTTRCQLSEIGLLLALRLHFSFHSSLRSARTNLDRIQSHS